MEGLTSRMCGVVGQLNQDPAAHRNLSRKGKRHLVQGEDKVSKPPDVVCPPAPTNDLSLEGQGE